MKLELVPLISGINDSDAGRYYTGTAVLWMDGGTMKVGQFSSKAGRVAVVVLPDGRPTNVLYSSLHRCNYPPFVDKDGRLHGLVVQRSPRRGAEITHLHQLEHILQMVMDPRNHDSPKAPSPVNGSHLAGVFTVQNSDGIDVLLYALEPVGFIRKGGLFYVTAPEIKERLIKLGVGTDESVQVLA